MGAIQIIQSQIANLLNKRIVVGCNKRHREEAEGKAVGQEFCLQTKLWGLLQPLLNTQSPQELVGLEHEAFPLQAKLTANICSSAAAAASKAWLLCSNKY